MRRHATFPTTRTAPGRSNVAAVSMPVMGLSMVAIGLPPGHAMLLGLPEAGERPL
ncbi:hypothetical protein ACQP2T_20040 [Nonomuraea sp. CA-143628]|uniref:hypothetical protein n=1 Tax=Nonomuraea sp. CA-143628 TaxID=3239997 RepID=UPI003D8FD7C7